MKKGENYKYEYKYQNKYQSTNDEENLEHPPLKRPRLISSENSINNNNMNLNTRSLAVDAPAAVTFTRLLRHFSSPSVA